MKATEVFDRAIAAHARWKFELREAIDTGKSQWAVRDVRTDSACEFGKWLAALPESQRRSEHYTKVRALHAEFHTVAAEVLELALAGRKDEANAAVAFGSRFTVVSANLTGAVLAWQKDLSRNQSDG